MQIWEKQLAANPALEPPCLSPCSLPTASGHPSAPPWKRSSLWPPALWLQQHEVIEAIRTTWDGSSPRNGHQPMKGTTSFVSHSCHLPKQPGCRLHRFYSQQFSLQCQLPFLYKRKTLIGFSLLSKKGGCRAIQSQNLFPISSGPEHRSLQTWEGEGGKEGRRQGGREGETRGQSVDTYTSLF